MGGLVGSGIATQCLSLARSVSPVFSVSRWDFWIYLYRVFFFYFSSRFSVWYTPPVVIICLLLWKSYLVIFQSFQNFQHFQNIKILRKCCFQLSPQIMFYTKARPSKNANSAIIFLINYWSIRIVKMVWLVRVVEVVQDVKIVQVGQVVQVVQVVQVIKAE